MNIVFASIAGVAAIGGSVMLWWRARVSRDLGLMQATPTSKTAEAAKMPAGSFVEVVGTLRCAAPLIGEFSKKPCVYYQSIIQRRYETDRRGSDGKTERETRTETVRSDEHFAPAAVEDASGKIAINFHKASVEALEVVRRYEPESTIAGSIIGSLINAGDRTLGHTYIESILPPDIPVFVMGTVLVDGCLGASPTKANIFVVSHKSKEQRTKDLISRKMWILVGAIVLFIAAVALLGVAVNVG